MVENQPSYREDTNFSAQRFYLEIINENLLTNLPEKPLEREINLAFDLCLCSL